MKNYVIIKERKLMLQEAFCATVAIIIGVIIEISFKFSGEHGYWIPMTITLMFIRPVQGSIVSRSSDRIFGTFLGLTFGFLYVSIFLYADYRWGYLLPLIWFFLFYIYGITGNYCITVMIVTMFLPIMFAVMYPTEFGVGGTLIRRLVFTGIGVIIALLCEFLIYKKAALSSRKLRNSIKEYFRNISKIINISNECFIEGKSPTKEYRKIAINMMNTISSIENNYSNFRYEFEYDDNKEAVSAYLFNSMEKISLRLRKIICIAGHSSLDQAAYDKDEFFKICSLINDKYYHVRKYIHGRKDDSSEILESFINDNSYNVFSSLLYAKEMYELSKIFDDLTEFIYKKKYSA